MIAYRFAMAKVCLYSPQNQRILTVAFLSEDIEHRFHFHCTSCLISSPMHFNVPGVVRVDAGLLEDFPEESRPGFGMRFGFEVVSAE